MTSQQSRLIWLLVFAVLVWGTIHAVGAYRYNHNPYRAIVVLACVVAYLGFWMLLLKRRQSRLR